MVTCGRLITDDLGLRDHAKFKNCSSSVLKNRSWGFLTRHTHGQERSPIGLKPPLEAAETASEPASESTGSSETGVSAGTKAVVVGSLGFELLEAGREGR